MASARCSWAPPEEGGVNRCRPAEEGDMVRISRRRGPAVWRLGEGRPTARYTTAPTKTPEQDHQHPDELVPVLYIESSGTLMASTSAQITRTRLAMKNNKKMTKSDSIMSSPQGGGRGLHPSRE